MPIFGMITNILDKQYVDRGYRLFEDEDFVYLYTPDDENPHVFSTVGCTKESIQTLIEKLEGGE